MMWFIAHSRPVAHVQAFNGNADVGHFFSQSTLPTERSSRASILSVRARLSIHDRGLARRADNPRFLFWDPFKTATEYSLRASSCYQGVPQRGLLSFEERTMKSDEQQEFNITRISPYYWRLTIDHPPFNIFGPQSIPMLDSIVTEIESAPKVKVVVFDSAVRVLFQTYFNFIPPLETATGMPPGSTGLPPLPDIFV